MVDIARYSVLPSRRILIVDKDGTGNCWVLAPGRWQWVRAADMNRARRAKQAEANLARVSDVTDTR